MMDRLADPAYRARVIRALQDRAFKVAAEAINKSPERREEILGRLATYEPILPKREPLA